MGDERKPQRSGKWSNTHKLLIVGAVLFLVFMGFYSAFTGDESSRESGIPDWLLYAIAAFAAVMFGSLAFVNVRNSRRFLREQHVALAALHHGELAKARELFWTWSESRINRIAAISRHNLAWTLMRQGEIKYAVATARNAIDRYWRELRDVALLPTTLVDLALFHALAGELETAEKVMLDLEQRKDLPAPASFPSMKVFTRAVIACRTGHAADAARMLEDSWASCESLLTGDVLRPLRVVRAFAIAAADVRDAGKAAAQLTSARPAYRGEYDFLGTSWPEMQTFLDTHELASLQ